MTEVTQLLADCEARGVKLYPSGNDGLTVDGPEGSLTDDLMVRLKAHKLKLLAGIGPSTMARAIDTNSAAAVWQAVLDQLEGDPLFPPFVLKELGAVEARWITS